MAFSSSSHDLVSLTRRIYVVAALETGSWGLVYDESKGNDKKRFVRLVGIIAQKGCEEQGDDSNTYPPQGWVEAGP